MKWVSVAFVYAVFAFTGMAIAADGEIELPSTGRVEIPSATPEHKVDPRKPVYNKPLYNPETKSYFELHFPGEGMSYGESPEFNWRDAREYAPSRVFRGVRGRLAIVKTKETNDFIVKNLKPGCCPWIGLYFSCAERTLVWVTGEIWPLTAYNNWSRIWNVMGTHPNKPSAKQGCTPGGPPSGVHYWGPDGQYKWNTNSANKAFHNMIIEYPTGKP